MRCRICGSERVQELGSVEFYFGYPWSISDCFDCRCRFTPCDPEVHKLLHTEEQSRYGAHWELARNCKLLFAKRDLAGIRKLLSATPKNRYVIDEIEGLSGAKKLLEVGCSRGYLTAFFILAGYDVHGVDISPDAISGAGEAFGDHFFLADSERISENQPYDVIYHVGTIGCVEDPVEHTKRMLQMLRPGGVLLFNAPNADACWLPGQLWIDGALPPDVVTLFRKGFWTERFGDVAAVKEVVEYSAPELAFSVFVRKLLRQQWQRPQPLPLKGAREAGTAGKGGMNGQRRLVVRAWRILRRIAVLSGVAGLVPPQPTEGNILVKMVRE
jgi:SAM-dependent methyltransferase